MKLKRWIQSTIGLSSSEANAMMILLPSIFIIIFSEPVYRLYLRPTAAISVPEEKFLDSLVSATRPTRESRQIEILRFSFDPNTSSLDELKKLGVSEAIGKRIIQYRNKGGQFRIKSDLGKIYGMDSTLFQALAPYILLPDRLEKREVLASRESPEATVVYDLNLTDTTSLKSVKGIGSVLSKRIIKYRDRLGGFISARQLREVYGLDSIVAKGLSSFFVADNFQPLPIMINSATEEQLSTHPYLSLRDAKAITTYRLQHGRFSSLDDLLRIKTMKESAVTKIAPYLSFE